MGRSFQAAAVLAAFGMALGAARPLAAQLRDSFEGPQATWTLKEADCGVRLLDQERTYREARSGQASEHIRLGVGQGTFVFLAQSIGKAPVIPELKPSLFVKADRASVQLMARVVFPRNIDKGSGQPITGLLRGDLYTDVGNWQQLTIPDPAKLLALETVGLRTRLGSEIDPREAYIDLLVLNAYSAPGNIDLWLDDLEIQGYVNLDDAAGPQISRRPSSPDGGGSSAPLEAGPPAVLQGSLLLVRGRPLAPRILQHNGEPLEWLKTLGFNAVKLSASPSPQELTEARRLGMWLVAPPPYEDQGPGAQNFDSVLAWSLGSRLTERDLAGTRDLVTEIRRLEPHQQRPLVASIDSGLGELSRAASVLILDRNPLGTSVELSSHRSWLLARSRLARAGTPVWAAVTSTPPEKLTEQLVLFGHGAPTQEDIDPEQLRLQAYSALAAGARGLVFPSPTPLAIDSSAAALRTDALKLLNLELRLLDPWISAGTLAEQLAAGDASVQVSVVQTDRSRLLLITQHAAAQQYVLGPPPRSTLNVTVPGASISDRAYQVSLSGIKQLRVTHSGGGARLTIDDAGLATAVVITQDPLALHHLNRTLAEIRLEAARLRYDVAVRRLAQVVEIDGQLGRAGHGLRSSAEWLRDAQTNLEQARRLFESGDLDNLHAYVARGEVSLAKVRRGHWEQTAASFPAPATSPCIAQFATLPLHWAVADRLRKGAWSVNVQAGGDMEALDQMVKVGWQQERASVVGIASDVSLSLQNPHAGRSALRMQAWVSDPKQAPQVIERPLAWITSAPVPVRQGQIVRIHGWVSVPRQLAGSTDGLLVFDSIAGPDLGDRVQLTQGWRELTLYRAAPATGDLTVTFALTGVGEAWIDDLAVTLLDPEPLRPAP